MTRILIIEDETDLGEIMEELLSYHELLADHVASAEEAKDVLEATVYDALIIDLFLPIMDGLQLIKWIRSNPQINKLPCIAVTSYGSSTLRKQAIEAGYNRYLPKPVNHNKLIDTLLDLLG